MYLLKIFQDLFDTLITYKYMQYEVKQNTIKI